MAGLKKEEPCTCKLGLRQVSLSLGFTGVVLSLVCAVFVWFFPDFSIWFFKSLFHNSIAITPVSMSFASVVTGAVSAFVTGVVLGVLFVPVYNYCFKHCR